MQSSLVTLNKSEIDYLYDYTDRHNIKFKDVQIELVDHLASGVEALMINDQNLTFNRALYEFTGTLPANFYNKFIAEKSKALKSYWRKQIGSYLIGFFTIPKIIISIALYYSIFNLINYFSTHDFIIMVFVFIAMIYGFLLIAKSDRRYAKQSPNFLFLKIFFEAKQFFYIMLFEIPFFIIWINDRDLLSSKIGLIVLSLSLTSMIIFTFASKYVFNTMLKHEIHKKYTQFNIQMV